MSSYKSHFVIITAIPEELRQFKEAVSRLNGKLDDIDGSGVHKGELKQGAKSFTFYAACQFSPGMTSAAILAARMIDLYRPRYIVMVGIAAGFDRKLAPGSVLIADGVANYQQGKVTDKGFVRDVVTFQLDQQLKGRFMHHKDQIIQEINNEALPFIRPIEALIGPIVAGNQVVASRSIMEGLKDSFRKVIGVEMEGFAIFQAAAESQHPQPIPFLIKSVCDFGDEQKDDQYHKLAAYTSASFFLRFALRCLDPEPIETAPSGEVEVTPWRQLTDRDEARVKRLLDGAVPESEDVRFIAITARSVLVPNVDTFNIYKPMNHFERALSRGVKFRGIVLDPDSPEARFRLKVESPGLKSNDSLLRRDARIVSKRLEGAPDFWRENLRIGYSRIGLAFRLWLFQSEAYIEPYHVGKLDDDVFKPESPLCAFSHVWYRATAPEYGLLVNHFEQLWKECKKRWPD
jgi:nucleoside phosphorylase